MTGLIARLKAWEKGLHARYNADFSTPENAAKARFYNRWLDHEVLRVHWTNLAEIAPGAWRSNHPPEARFRKMAEMGVKAVLNLRGPMDRPYYRLEVALCEELGMELIDLRMHAAKAPPAETLIRLIEIFRTIPHPFLMHCKSGADRTGLASAVYYLVILGKPLSEAQTMLSRRFIHFDNKRTGILDHVLRCFGEYTTRTGHGFETWLADEYDPARITESHLARYK